MVVLGEVAVSRERGSPVLEIVRGLLIRSTEGHGGLQGYFAHQKTPTPLGPPRTLGIGRRKDPMGVRFLVSKGTLMTPLYRFAEEKTGWERVRSDRGLAQDHT